MITILWKIFYGSWGFFFLFLISTIILTTASMLTNDFEAEGRILRIAAITWPACLLSLVVALILIPVLMF